MFAYVIFAGSFITQVNVLYVPHAFLFALAVSEGVLRHASRFLLIFLTVICPELEVLYVNNKEVNKKQKALESVSVE